MDNGCRHSWAKDEPYKRVCAKCGQREMLMYNRFPSAERPALRWLTTWPASPIMPRLGLVARAKRVIFGR